MVVIMGDEEASSLASPQNSKENYEHKNEEPNEKVEENALALVSVIDHKDKISSPLPEKETESGIQKSTRSSKDRDTALAKVASEKRLALIKAWEDNEKTKAENKALKKLSGVGAWENTKKAAIEAELRQIEEELEKKKAEYAEKMKNKMAEIHREAEEKRAMVEAKRGEEVLKLSTYSSLDGVLYCKPHFGQIYKEKGGAPLKHSVSLGRQNELNRSSSKVSALFSGTRDKCAACKKTVYPLEKVTVDGEMYHNICFRCVHGGCKLTTSSYAAFEGSLYCKPHFSQLFKQKGSYNHLTKTTSMKKSGFLINIEQQQCSTPPPAAPQDTQADNS